MKVAFRYGDTRLVSRFVAWWQNSDVSHCELVLSDEIEGTYLCGSSSFLDGGVRTKYINLPSSKWRIYEVEPEKGVTPGAWFSEHRGEIYDWFGLFGFVIRRIKGWAKAWWCSEACADALGWPESWRYSVVDFENACRLVGKRVQ